MIYLSPYLDFINHNNLFQMHEKLKQVREAAGLSHADLFHKTKVQAHQIKLYEAGKKDFMANTLVKLFEACGYSLVVRYEPQLINGEGEE